MRSAKDPLIRKRDEILRSLLFSNHIQLLKLRSLFIVHTRSGLLTRDMMELKTQTPSPNPELGQAMRSAKDPLIENLLEILRSLLFSNHIQLLKLRSQLNLHTRSGLLARE